MKDTTTVGEESNPSVIQADWSSIGHVSAFTTTRSGGVSAGPYASLNLGLHVGDDRASVLENRSILQRLIARQPEPHWLEQSHSTTIVCVDADTATSDGDGAYTTTSGKVLAVLTADCLPVVLTNFAETELAVVHAGWRGLSGGILKNVVNCFDDTEGLRAWLGPAIGPKAFEVGNDVYNKFIKNMGSNKQYFKPGVIQGKHWCDLYALAAAQLLQHGCKQVSGGEYCTYLQSDKFFSHRRDGVPSGRMATVAWLA